MAPRARHGTVLFMNIAGLVAFAVSLVAYAAVWVAGRAARSPSQGRNCCSASPRRWCCLSC